MIDSDKIVAQELNWVYQNEPTFHINGNSISGKVGRTLNGEDIMISITIPEFYPVIKPEVKVLTDIAHPNIENNGKLSLQLLDEWTPEFRLRDIIRDTRRLFVKSLKSVSSKPTRAQPVNEDILSRNLELEVRNIQKQISEINKQITEQKNSRLRESGTKQSEYLKVTESSEIKATINAITDLMELLIYKFENAEIDQVDFFKLYRRYIKELYISSQKLATIEVNQNFISEKKTKRPIRH